MKDNSPKLDLNYLAELIEVVFIDYKDKKLDDPADRKKLVDEVIGKTVTFLLLGGKFQEEKPVNRVPTVFAV